MPSLCPSSAATLVSLECVWVDRVLQPCCWLPLHPVQGHTRLEQTPAFSVGGDSDAFSGERVAGRGVGS